MSRSRDSRYGRAVRRRVALPLAGIALLLVIPLAMTVNAPRTAAAQGGTCPPLDTSPQTGPAAPGPGPWLLYTMASPSGIGYPPIRDLWAASADGASVRQVVAESPESHPLAYTPGPGGHVAYLTLSTDREPWLQPCLALNLLDLETGTHRAVARLTSDAVEASDEFPPDAKRAIADEPSLAWSPDGSQLAFIAALGDSGADLYLYDVAGDFIKRLSDEPDHAALPTWSPDGAYIAFQEMRTFGTGAGYAVEHLWAAAADGTGIVDLFAVGEDAYTGGEIYIGWTGAGELVFHDFINRANLRRANPATGETVLLREACLDDAALDPTTGTTLVVLHPAEYGCGREDSPAGAFLVSPDGSTVQAVEGDSFDPAWSAVDERFYTLTYGSGIVSIAPSGEAAVVATMDDGWYGMPLISPDGSTWAWTGNGVWVGPYGEPPRQIDEAIVYQANRFVSPLAAWHPDGDRLLYVGDEALYTAAAPNFAPELVAEGLTPTGWFWAYP